MVYYEEKQIDKEISNLAVSLQYKENQSQYRIQDSEVMESLRTKEKINRLGLFSQKVQAMKLV